MKITIIGTGNMGGAIAKGLASQPISEISKICITNRSIDKLEKLHAEFPNLIIEEKSEEAIKDADLIILAVKPWIVEPILQELKFSPNQILASVAAGITFKQMEEWCKGTQIFYRIIPNTAITYQASMNIIASYNTNPKEDDLILSIFNHLGSSIIIPESKMAAATSISSCGIAYLFKYIQASMQAGIELGLTSQEAIQLTAQTAIGAGSIFIQDKNAHPSVEMDRVSTPGGLTIKGLNELDKKGFPSAIIEAIKKSI